MSGVILRFPVEKEMPIDVARSKIGDLKRFRYPSGLNEGLEVWIERFLIGKSVMLGWGPINRSLVSTFRAGNVRHIISRVGNFDSKKRPRVEVCCQGENLYPIYNWISENRELSFPVSLLNIDQAKYFRVCEKCQQYLLKNGSFGNKQIR
jgi:hypothetical protein